MSARGPHHTIMTKLYRHPYRVHSYTASSLKIPPTSWLDLVFFRQYPTLLGLYNGKTWSVSNLTHLTTLWILQGIHSSPQTNYEHWDNILGGPKSTTQMHIFAVLHRHQPGFRHNVYKLPHHVITYNAAPVSCYSTKSPFWPCPPPNRSKLRSLPKFKRRIILK